MQTRWIILSPPSELVATLAQALPCSRVMATLLANRGIKSARQAQAFINPSLTDLRPPDNLKDLDPAVERIYRAIRDNEKILIFGDYDVDGVTATAVLYEFLGYAGADVAYYLPHRLTEGYSLQRQHVTEVAAPQGVNLIITADCGSTSYEAIATARDTGIDVIITDHHEIPELPKDALATINPKRPDCLSGLETLAGVGVAFYLIVALRRYLREKSFWSSRPEPNLKSLCDLVALGTIADMVPLKAENRIITRHGMEMITCGHRPGIAALIKASGLLNAPVNTDTLAYYLAPRLNAAGRMDHADLALQLLVDKNDTSAATIASRLQQLNSARQQAEKTILENIQSHIHARPRLLEAKSLVLWHAGWHPGVLGIAASRLARQYHRPIVLISTDGDVGLGSARSIPGINLYKALDACKRRLIGFGGHPMAAGLRIQTGSISAFQDDLEMAVTAQAADVDLMPEITIDCEIDFNDISSTLIDAVESLQPFGNASPKPLFMASNVQVCSSKIVGAAHRRMVLSQGGRGHGARFEAIQFNIDQKTTLPAKLERIAFELQWNRWNGNVKPQLVVTAIEDPAAPPGGPSNLVRKR